MGNGLREICHMAQSISGAAQVSISLRKRYSPQIDVLVRAMGVPIERDSKYKLPLLTRDRPHVLIPDTRKLAAFEGHPIFEILPDLRMVEGFLWPANADDDFVFILWNPRQAYLRSPPQQRHIMQLFEIVRAILNDAQQTDRRPPQEPLAEPSDRQAFAEEASPFCGDPATAFLAETLPKKQRLLARNGVSFIALRQWRKAIKPYQISALAALKRHGVREVAEIISEEMAEASRRVFGQGFDAIVPIPCGSSGTDDCLSVQLAQLVAAKTQIRYANVLLPEPVRKGSSHPAKSAKLAPYKTSEPLAGRILIIDDVASSGRHLELAAKALVPAAQHATGLVWISD